jgi:membrane protein required for colicin V production
MNWLDITILCLCGVGLIKGLFDGMIKQVVALAALIIGLYLCSAVAGWLCGYATGLEWFPPKAVVPVSYVLGFILIVGIVLLAGNIVHRLISATPLGFFNHLFGGFLGVMLMVLFISIIFNIMELVDIQSTFLSQEVKVESRFYNIIRSIIPVLPGNLFEIKLEIPH